MFDEFGKEVAKEDDKAGEENIEPVVGLSGADIRNKAKNKYLTANRDALYKAAVTDKGLEGQSYNREPVCGNILAANNLISWTCRA